MLFNSVSYVIFLPVCAGIYYVVPYKMRNLFLLAASYYFYMCWMPQYALLIGFSTVVTWLAGYWMDQIQNPAVRRGILGINIACNLGILFLFKYYNFFTDVLERICNGAVQFEKSSLLLPVGISFYTFQALGYSIDVYKTDAGGGIRHEKNFLNYALFVSFFPQLVAGPIERSRNLLKQFHSKHEFSIANTVAGLRILLTGMYKKVVIADMAALTVDQVFQTYTDCSGLTLLLGMFLFAVQIYGDFSGYSDVARGSALIFGFRLMENFKAPYLSVSIKEFWGRWHISLSSWLKDYIYIPLGGSKRGRLCKYRNLIIVFLISGIWHGAAYTYILWGLLHGMCRVAEECMQANAKRGKKQAESRLGTCVKTVLVFGIVTLLWTYFRSDRVAQGNWIITHCLKDISLPKLIEEYCGILGKILPPVPGLGKLYTWIVFLSILLLAGCDWCYQYRGKAVPQLLADLPFLGRWLCYYGMIILIMFSFVMTTNAYGQAGAFLYFQF